ncbi:hypothetical protein AAMO2058_000823400, partial [Amorphochlora amoebiformis]
IIAIERLEATDLCKILVAPKVPGLYHSLSPFDGNRDIDCLFSDGFPIQRTLVMIKPNAYPNLADILAVIKQNGFKVIVEESMTLSKARSTEFYAEHKGRSFFERLTTFMSSGPIHAMVLQKPAAIKSWRTLIGKTDVFKARIHNPNCLRARWGLDQTRNGFHGSDSEKSAAREIKFFFPTLTATTLADPEVFATADLSTPTPTSLKDVLVEGLTKLCRSKPVGLEAIEWLGRWLIENNPARPNVQDPEPNEVGPKQVELGGGEEPKGEETLTLPASIKRSKVRVVTILGPEGARTEKLARELAEDIGLEHISVPRMLKAASKTAARHIADPIRDSLMAGRASPANPVQFLLNKAIGAFLDSEPSEGSVILLSSFPHTLDQALKFTEDVGEPTLILSLEGDVEQFEAMAASGAEKEGISEQVVKRRALRFKEETRPVIEHYRKFGKVHSIRDRGDMGSVLEAVKAQMANLN